LAAVKPGWANVKTNDIVVVYILKIKLCFLC
jgi:hypothetical protein